MSEPPRDPHPRRSPTDRLQLESLLGDLREAGARRIRVVGEADDGGLENGEMRLEVGVIYDHWGMEERMRRFLTTLDDAVHWEGREWTLETTLGTDPSARGITVYDREEERVSGTGTHVTRLYDAVPGVEP